MPYEIPQLIPTIQQIEAYIISHHGCTSRELANEFELEMNAVSTYAGRLRSAGKIRRFRIPGERQMRWAAGRDDDYLPSNGPNEGQPKQTTVTTWEPVKGLPQSWAAALGL